MGDIWKQLDKYILFLSPAVSSLHKILLGKSCVPSDTPARWPVYQIPIVAVTRYHKLAGLKQYTFIPFSIWRSEI